LGRPFYQILLYLFIGLVFSISWLGKATRRLGSRSLTLGKSYLNLSKNYLNFDKNYLKRLKNLNLFQFRPVKLDKKRKVKKALFLSQKKKKKKQWKLSVFKWQISWPKLPQVKLPTFAIKTNRKTAVVFFVLIFLVFGLWYFIFKGLPSPRELVTRNQEVSTKIYDRNGILLYKIYKDENRTLIPLSDVPEHVRYATLAAEDAEFYSHPGFSLRGMLRAVIRNATRGELTGGSTITQQLVKNALLSPEKTVTRKIKEIILSVETEMIYPKDKILEMYLNEVSYGGTAYGIEEASEQYFGRSTKDLTLAQAALLAGLPKSPTKYSPFGSDPQKAKDRQSDVLYLMKVNGFITQEDLLKAQSEELVFNQNKTEIKAPHFVMYVRQFLAEKYGEEMLQKGGLEVMTTLDWEIQKLAEKAVQEEVAKLNSLHVTNGASLVISPQTGEVLAMVGSKDYFDHKNDGNVNVITSPRQPGSSIKVVNYAYALAHGYTSASIISDTPISFAVAGQPTYTPKNYDDKYRGNITLRSALAESRNIPAVKILASYGVSQMIELGEKMGITTWEDKSRFGLSLTLGGGEVKLIDLARVFATIANYGKKPEIVSVLKVTDHEGEELEVNKSKSENVLDPRVAFLMTDILKDNSARSPAFGSRSALVITNHPEVAVKTGTSNNLRDNLTVGFNQEYLVAVWVGNNDNSPMSRIASGITGAAPIWNKIMSGLLADKESRVWEAPTGVVKLSICTLTGTLPCSGCPTKQEWFLTESAPKMACKTQTVEKIMEEKKKSQEMGQILPQAASVVN